LTIWLAHNRFGKPVALKGMRIEVSCKPLDEIPEAGCPPETSGIHPSAGYPAAGSNIQTVEDHFTENEPNGSQLCLVSHFAGPSILSMSGSPGSRHLQRDLARKVASKWLVG